MSNYYCPHCGKVASKEPCQHCGRYESSFAQASDSALPMVITIRVSATNGSTLLKGIEAVRAQFQTLRIPKAGEVFEGQFFRAEITECVDRLPNQITRDTSNTTPDKPDNKPGCDR